MGIAAVGYFLESLAMQSYLKQTTNAEDVAWENTEPQAAIK